MKLINWIVCTVFEWHCDKHHNADYEVCRHPLCFVTYRIENFVKQYLWR